MGSGPNDHDGTTLFDLIALPARLAALGALALLVLLTLPRPADAATARTTAATVTINQAAGQADPTTGSPVVFTAVFNQAVTGFATGDVTLTGTAGATTATVSGSGTTYTVNVTGMTKTGTVVATIPADVVTGGNSASTSADNEVTFTDSTKPSVTVDQGPAQVDPAAAGPIVFRAVFSEPVTGFADGDVTIAGTANAATANVSGSGTTYTISVTGMTQAGTVIASIAASKVTDLSGNQNLASTSTDNQVTYAPPVDTTKPSVTVEQAPGQVDPTTTSPIAFRAVFSEPVTGFASGDVTLAGTAGATTAAVSGSGTTYTINVTGMTQTGTVIASIAASKVTDAAGNGNTASTSTDNQVTFTSARPTVTINQASAQADPTSSSPIVFTAVFSESVTGFAAGDVTLAGTAGATTVAISGGGTTYTVNVSGMTQAGTVIASIAANVVSDGSGDQNLASTSTDNTVTYQAPVAVAVAYAGDRSVKVNRRMTVAARLTTVPPDSSCRSGKQVTFHLDRNPGPLGSPATLPGVDGSWVPLASATTSREGGAATSVSTTGWATGTYRILAYVAATPGCPAASGNESLSVVRRGLAAQGAGWIRFDGRTEFRFTVTRVGDGPGDVRGSIAVWHGRRWKVVGSPTSITNAVCDGLPCADVAGTGRLYESIQVRGHRTRRTWDDRYRWVLRQRDAQFVLKLVDRGGDRGRSDRFGIKFTTPGLEGLRGSTGDNPASVRRGFVEIRTP